MPKALSIVMTVALFVTGVAAETIELDPIRDNTLYEHPTGALSNGQGASLFTGLNGGGSRRRAALAFDVSALPEGAVVTQAALTLTVAQTNVGPEPTTVHRLAADWGEAASVAPGNGGGGAPAEPGDATWLHTFSPDQLWLAEGGDFSPLASADTMVDGVGPYTWSSPALVADVQAWVDDPGTNFGWLLVGNEAPAAGTSKRFHSREAVDEAVRPVLTVEYDVGPVDTPATSGTGAIALVLLFLAAMGAARR